MLFRCFSAPDVRLVEDADAEDEDTVAEDRVDVEAARLGALETEISRLRSELHEVRERITEMQLARAEDQRRHAVIAECQQRWSRAAISRWRNEERTGECNVSDLDHISRTLKLISRGRSLSETFRDVRSKNQALVASRITQPLPSKARRYTANN